MNWKKWLDISTEITTQRAEKFLSERGNLECTCLLACLPACFVSTKKFSVWVQWKVFCHFWPIKVCDLYLTWYSLLLFFGEFACIILFMVWFQGSSQIKGRGYIFVPSIFMSVKHPAELIFLRWKLNILSFIFLIWMEQSWIWFSWKLTNFCCFLNFLLPPLWLSNLGSDLSISNITRPGLADTKVVSQNCCQEGARTHGKMKIPNPQR